MEPVYVRTIAERKPIYRGGITMFLDLPLDVGEEAHAKWVERYGKEFTFPNLRSPGPSLLSQAREALISGDEEAADNLFAETIKHTIKSYDEKSDPEKWGDMAVQLPGDWGPSLPEKRKLREMLTELAHGRVLEAMCGFNSYFGESDRVTDLVALDFCKEALERYEYPERERILYDLERIAEGERMDFFYDESFDTVGIVAGVNYLSDAFVVYREFHRILSRDGRLLVVNATSHGYTDMIKKDFEPEEQSKLVEAAGFSVRVEELGLTKENEIGEYFLIEGTKLHKP